MSRCGLPTCTEHLQTHLCLPKYTTQKKYKTDFSACPLGSCTQKEGISFCLCKLDTKIICSFIEKGDVFEDSLSLCTEVKNTGRKEDVKRVKMRQDMMRPPIYDFVLNLCQIFSPWKEFCSN